MSALPILAAGDLLLYDKRGLFNWIIKIKTWGPVSHCEVCISPWRVAASRNLKGVGLYSLDTEGLAWVLRPKEPFQLKAAMDWYMREARGQGYDLLGLFNFYSAALSGRDNGRMFCSEFATRFLRAGGVEPFKPDTDADRVAPSTFLRYSPAFEVVWRG